MVEVKGISGISAWLSSQLRIEDGKNVPDLVSMDLTPDEAGFITVKLDKHAAEYAQKQLDKSHLQ